MENNINYSEVSAIAKESMRFILQSVADDIWKKYHYKTLTINDTDSGVDAVFDIADENDKSVLEYILPYSFDGDDIIADFDQSVCVSDICKYLRKNNVTASKSVIGKDTIMAAVGDFDEDAFFDVGDDDEFAVDNEYDYENQDEVDRDTDSIDVDNNIENHYIMECSRCKGIFISALVESEQEVESIRGICPLCNHESDQIAKWIVRTI